MDQRVLQAGWGHMESRDWLDMMDTKASQGPLDPLDQKVKRGSKARMARLRVSLGPLEIGALWVLVGTEENLGTLATLDRRVFKASVEIRVSRADLDIRDPGGDWDPKDQKEKRDQRESKARPGHQDGGGSRACRGFRDPRVWLADRALRGSLDQMGFLAMMVKQDSRGSREMMGSLAPWVLLGREEMQVWLACLEHRGPQDSRVKVGYLDSWVPPASEGQKAEWGFLGVRGRLDPKANWVILVRWVSQEWLASSDLRAPLETSASRASRAPEGHLA